MARFSSVRCRADRLRARVWLLLAGPWGLKRAVAVLLAVALLDVALGYFSLPGLVDARRPARAAPAFSGPRLTEAVLDESAHALTGLLLFKAAGFEGGGLVLPMLAGAVLLDLDHLPMELGRDTITRGTNRPYGHALATVAGIAAAGLIRTRWRRLLLALAFGVGTHLLRDLATGGVPLFWPWLARRETIGYGVYLAILLVSGARLAWAHRPIRPAR
jgi:inner membrane protein